ncbi:unnamed protein product [Trichobilharzia regenti]|nr:unnamed protein product [Trichobilharzia regenti]
MLVGSAGTGKSVILQDKFSSLSEEYLVKSIPFNFYTTSLMLQEVLDKSLEKKAGMNYGPPGQHRLLYFIDDLNMPEVSALLSVSTFLRGNECKCKLHTVDCKKTEKTILGNAVTRYV